MARQGREHRASVRRLEAAPLSLDFFQTKNPLKAGFVGNGGPDKDRTCDLLHAMQALSQLSYRPLYIYYNSFFNKVQLTFIAIPDYS